MNNELMLNTVKARCISQRIDVVEIDGKCYVPAYYYFKGLYPFWGSILEIADAYKMKDNLLLQHRKNQFWSYIEKENYPYLFHMDGESEKYLALPGDSTIFLIGGFEKDDSVKVVPMEYYVALANRSKNVEKLNDYLEDIKSGKETDMEYGMVFIANIQECEKILKKYDSKAELYL